MEWRSRSPRERVDLAVLAFLFMQMGGSLFSLPILISLFAAQTELPEPAVGALVASAAPLQLILRIPGGMLPGVIGVRRTLLCALGLGVGSGLAFVGAGLTGSPWWVVAAQIFYSAAASFFYPVAWDRAAALGRGGARQVIGAMSVAAGMGQLTLPFINGLMIDRLGIVAPFALFAAGLTVSLALVALLVHSPGGSGDWTQLRGGFFKAGSLIRSTADVQLAMMIELSFFIVWTTFQAYYPLYALGRGMTAAQIGFLFSFHGLCAVTGRVMFTMIGSWVRADHLAYVSLTGCLAMTGLIILQPGQAVSLVLTAVGGLSYGLMLPDLLHLMTRTVSAAERALAASLHGLCTNAGKLAGGLIGSGLVALMPIPIVLTGLSGLTLLTISGAAVRRYRTEKSIAG